jgi:hypothetical protein
MSSISRPRFWLCSGAVAAALWITLRVVMADAAPAPRLAAEEIAASGEIADPALDALIRRFAAAATGSKARR